MTISLEELSLNAWPSLQTTLYDGWIIRFANGYTKRSNSVTPLYPSAIDLEQKLRFCEDIYQRHNLPTIFKLTEAIHPTGLDEALSAHGYQKESPTSVQVMDLEALEVKSTQEVNLQEDLSTRWLEAYCNMNAVSEKNFDTLRQILMSIAPHHCFVSATYENQIVACGVGVLQSAHIGLFSILTDEKFRRQGYGNRVIDQILSWGKQNGAQKAYLQVELNNATARRVYSKLGFVEKYQYWYRIKS